MNNINGMTDKQLNKTTWSETKMKKYGLTNREYKGRKIIFEDEIISVLKKEYDDVPPNIGRDTWSSILSKKYIGISRRRMYDFLKQQPMYQMGLQRVTQSMAKSIITSKPFERVQTDTIDSSKFSTSFPYTLTMIDTFSKKLYARPLKNHTADETLSKMKDIFIPCLRNQGLFNLTMGLNSQVST